MRGTSVEESVSLRYVVDVVEDIAVRTEGEVRRCEVASIEQQASEEGGRVCLVDDDDIVLDVLSLEEGVHVLEEGGEVLLPVSEWHQNGNPSGCLTGEKSCFDRKWIQTFKQFQVLQLPGIPEAGSDPLDPIVLPRHRPPAAGRVRARWWGGPGRSSTAPQGRGRVAGERGGQGLLALSRPLTMLYFSQAFHSLF